MTEFRIGTSVFAAAGFAPATVEQFQKLWKAAG